MNIAREYIYVIIGSGRFGVLGTFVGILGKLYFLANIKLCPVVQSNG